MYFGEPPARVLRQSGTQSAYARGHGKRWQGATHELHRVVHEHTRRRAGCIAYDAAAGSFTRIIRDGGTPEHRTVHPDRVAINALKHDRMPGADGIEFRGCRKLGRCPERLIPSRAVDPLAGRRRARRCTHTRQERRLRESAQLDGLQHLAQHRRVHMRVGEAGQRHAGEWHAASARTGRFQHVSSRAECHDAPVAHRDCLSARYEGVEREELAREYGRPRGGGGRRELCGADAREHECEQRDGGTQEAIHGDKMHYREPSVRHGRRHRLYHTRRPHRNRDGP